MHDEGHHTTKEGKEQRGRGEGRHSHYPWQNAFEERGHHRGEDCYTHHKEGHEGHQGGRRDRLERGRLRYVLLAALENGPKHGYEIIKWLEEQTGGRYSPSPGTVYPTLQLLNDQGFVQADPSAERCVYHLTESGQNDLNNHANFIKGFWERFNNPPAIDLNQPEVDFLREEMNDLNRTVWNGLRSALLADNQPMILEMRLTLERCQNEVREIITRHATTQVTDNTSSKETTKQQ